MEKTVHTIRFLFMLACLIRVRTTSCTRHGGLGMQNLVRRRNVSHVYNMCVWCVVGGSLL
jgi:hypothetical protein